MADNDSIAVNDFPSVNFMLNPYFYRLLNKDMANGSATSNYNKILEYTDDFHEYTLHLITGIDGSNLFDEETGTITSNVTLLDDVSIPIYLMTVMTEYGFYVVEDNVRNSINLEDNEVTIYGFILKDTSNEFVLLYGLYDEPFEECGEIFLDEGGVMQINISTICEVEI